MGRQLNDNTFYTIIGKLKKTGVLIHCEDRGMYRWNEEKNIDKKQLKSALDFVKEMISLINIDEEYYNMMNDSYPIDPWSVTPELYEGLEILKKIADGKSRLDNIVHKMH